MAEPNPPAFVAPIQGFLDMYRGSLESFASSLGSGSTVRWTDPSAVLEWMKTLAPTAGSAADGMQSHPLLAGLRHVYAGAADAVGWGLYTKLGDSLAQLGRAQTALNETQTKIWNAIREIWASAQAEFGETLKRMIERRESFADVQAFLQAWTAALDRAAHRAMQSEAGLVLAAEAGRSAANLRIAQNRAVEAFSEIYNIPTRAELDEAYRLIHELRKELRALKKGS